MKKKLLYLLCFSLMFMLLAGGCQKTTAKKPMAPSAKKPTQTSQMTPSERRVLASKLSKMAEQVKGVEKATVVVADIGIANNITGNTKTNAQMNRATAKNLNDNTIGSDAGINRSEPKGMIVMVGLTLKPGNNDMKVEIHLDVGIQGDTKELVKEVTGMIVGSGFAAKIKPDACAASTVADRYTK
jgi:predicted RNase H-related nuclease YkuK (DUF458 family)